MERSPMSKSHPFNTLASQLRPIAAQNADFMLQERNKAVKSRAFKYANQVETQRGRWADVAVAAPKKF
jgi:hypothetical protein